MPPVAPAATSRSCRTCPGPKLRIGKLRDGVVEFKPGDATTFVCGPDGGEGDASRLFITYAGLASTVERDEIMYLADGAVRLRISAVRPDAGEIDAVVEIGGAVASRQGLNIPGETAALPAVPEEDLEHVRTGERIGVDIVALSFVRRAEEVIELRKHTRLPLVAKIEKPQAVTRAEEIVRAADCVMVARGDLGIEMQIEEVPIVQKQIISLAGALARPVITATQMLDSMVASSRPTRAEVTDVANAILDGTDAVMLSQESAVGQWPVESVAMLATIAKRTEQTAPYREWNERRVRRDRRDPAYTLAYTATRAAHELNLDALVCPTLSGRSARLISAHRPTVPIMALSPGRETVRRCGLMWGVQAASMRRYEVTEELIAAAARARRRARLAQARRPRRDHRRPALGQARHDEPAADPRGVSGALAQRARGVVGRRVRPHRGRRARDRLLAHDALRLRARHRPLRRHGRSWAALPRRLRGPVRPGRADAAHRRASTGSRPASSSTGGCG